MGAFCVPLLVNAHTCSSSPTHTAVGIKAPAVCSHNSLHIHKLQALIKLQGNEPLSLLSPNRRYNSKNSAQHILSSWKNEWTNKRNKFSQGYQHSFDIFCILEMYSQILWSRSVLDSPMITSWPLTSLLSILNFLYLLCSLMECAWNPQPSQVLWKHPLTWPGCQVRLHIKQSLQAATHAPEK